jgi:hypothetical protein
MPDIDQIAAAIETRLESLLGEMEALEEARRALLNGGDSRSSSEREGSGRRRSGRRRSAPAAGRSPARARTPTAARTREERKPEGGSSGRARTAGGPRPGPAPARGRAARAGTPAPAPERARDAVSPPESTGSAQAPGRGRRRGIEPETVESMLRQFGGLSAVAIAKRSGVPYDRVRELLLELERDGHVRGEGHSRTSLWRLSDPERGLGDEDAAVAARTAELEAQFARTGGRPARGSAGSSGSRGGGGDAA